MKRLAALALVVVLGGCSAARKAQESVTPENVKAGLCAYRATKVYDLKKLSAEQAVQLGLDVAECYPREAGDAGAP